MNIRSRAIILNKTKYSESSVIVKAFTREAGVQSFILKQGQTGPSRKPDIGGNHLRRPSRKYQIPE